MRLSEVVQLVQEGGAIFKHAHGGSRTQPIHVNQIPRTLKWLEQITQLPLQGNTLGSVGKKTHSGDLDIAVDARKITKDELITRLSEWVKSQGEDPKQWIRKSGISVHFLCPIQGDPDQGFVQCDLMFDSHPEWMKFSMYSAGDASAHSGAARNQLMASLAKSQGLKYSWQKGLLNRSDESVITKDPDQIAVHLLGPGNDLNHLLSVETILHALDTRPELKQKLLNLAHTLSQTTDASGEPLKPGVQRANQEEAVRIMSVLD
jgi:hypothetical protein